MGIFLLVLTNIFAIVIPQSTLHRCIGTSECDLNDFTDEASKQNFFVIDILIMGALFWASAVRS